MAMVRHALRPSVPSLSWALARLQGPRDATGPANPTRYARPRWWRPAPVDLAITGTSESRFAAQLVTTSVGLVVVTVSWLAVMSLLGTSPSGELAMLALVTASGAGLVVPGELLRRQARRRRLAFGHALSTFLDLVSVLLAGGAGIETSLTAAAEAGDGWVFSMVRDELVRARTRRRSPWDGLADLGRRLGVDELVDLAATVQLAGEHGARVRNSLTTRAGAVRERHLSQVEADAQAATERMGLPMVLVFVGFIALLGYPALSSIVGGL